MRLIIAEKPSLARAIADAIGVTKTERVASRTNYVCGDDIVAAASGHVFELKLMEDYDATYKVWANGTYPYMPETWEYKKKSENIDVIDNLETLLSRADCVVNAGDADREGQLLIDEILEYFDWNGETYRLLITDTNPDAVRSALSNMKPNGEYKSVSSAGKARSMADWLLGMNMSRVCALKAGGGVKLSVGRVQTPLVGLIVRRDKEISEFVPKDFFSPITTFDANGTSFFCKWKPKDDQDGLDDEGRLVSTSVRDDLETRVKSAVIAGDKARVVKIGKKPCKTSPPMPHSLPTLQIESNEKHSFSPSDTLALVQSMYERGVVTYPRSDCAYLPMSYHSDAANICDGIRSVIQKNDLKGSLSDMMSGADLSLTSAAFDDSKVAEHFAIVPTGKVDSLSANEAKIYDLIASRYVIQFYPPHKYLETKGEISFIGETFLISGRETTHSGWRLAIAAIGSDDDAKDDEDNPTSIPALSDGEEISAVDIKMRAKKTTPPKAFTDATLLKAMNGIHKYVTDPQIKKVLKETDGLGTAATQAGIIDKIMQFGYVQHDGKKIVSTDKGRDLIRQLPEALTTPDRTALWEMEMSRIADGEMTIDQFIGDVFDELKALVEIVNASENFSFRSESSGDPKVLCFACSSPMRCFTRKDGSGKFWKCTNESCGKFYNDVKGKPQKPELCPRCGKELRSGKRKSDGKPFWACSCGLFLDDIKGKPQKTRKCPKCGGLQRQMTAKSGSLYWRCVDDKCGEVSFEDAKTKSAKKGR